QHVQAAGTFSSLVCTLSAAGLQVVHIVSHGLSDRHRCSRLCLRRWAQGKVLRLREAKHTGAVGWLNIIGNAGEACDLIGAATVVAAYGPVAGLVSVTADVTEVQLPRPQAQPMRLAPLRQPAAGCARLNFFTWRGTGHRFPNIGPIKRCSMP